MGAPGPAGPGPGSVRPGSPARVASAAGPARVPGAASDSDARAGLGLPVPRTAAGVGRPPAHEFKNTFTEEFKLQHSSCSLRTEVTVLEVARAAPGLRVRAVTGAVALTNLKAAPGARRRRACQ